MDRQTDRWIDEQIYKQTVGRQTDTWMDWLLNGREIDRQTDGRQTDDEWIKDNTLLTISCTSLFSFHDGNKLVNSIGSVPAFTT